MGAGGLAGVWTRVMAEPTGIFRRSVSLGLRPKATLVLVVKPRTDCWTATAGGEAGEPPEWGAAGVGAGDDGEDD